MNITINPLLILKFFLYIIFGFIIMNIIAYYLVTCYPGEQTKTLSFLFDLDTEHNIPSVFSFLQLELAAFLLALIGFGAKSKDRRSASFWLLLSAIFLYLGIDELKALHERTMDWVRQFVPYNGIFYYAWIIPGILFCFITGMFFLKFVRELPEKTRKGIIISGFVYVAAAIGGDMVAGKYISQTGISRDWFVIFENTVEEGLEMISIAYFSYVLLCYFRDHISGNIRIGFTSAELPDKQTRASKHGKYFMNAESSS